MKSRLSKTVVGVLVSGILLFGGCVNQPTDMETESSTHLYGDIQPRSSLQEQSIAATAFWSNPDKEFEIRHYGKNYQWTWTKPCPGHHWLLTVHRYEPESEYSVATWRGSLRIDRKAPEDILWRLETGTPPLESYP